MRPNFFMDLDIRCSGVQIPVACGRVMHVLHGAFRQMPDKFAIAFPAEGSIFSTMRVFASSIEDLLALQAAVEMHESFEDHAHPRAVKAVPGDFTGEWVSYVRFRIPTRKSDRHEGAPLRLRRMREADDLPYLRLHSRSSRTSFSLHFNPAVVNKPEGECLPDSYGLSTTTKVFGLPRL